MQTKEVNLFLKEQFGQDWQLKNGVCHIDNNGNYFATIAYQEPRIHITFIYKHLYETISPDMANSLLLLNAHPEIIGRGAFSLTDNGVILLSFNMESKFFSVLELKEFWDSCLNWREAYFNFLNDNYHHDMHDSWQA